MFNEIINNTLFISVISLNGGLLYKCFKDIYDESKMKNNVFMSYSNSIFNTGMFTGALIGVTYTFLKCSLTLNEMLKLKNWNLYLILDI